MVCEELMSGKLSLFIPTRNNASTIGMEQDKMLPNCGCVGATHIAMFEFIGVAPFSAAAPWRGLPPPPPP